MTQGPENDRPEPYVSPQHDATPPEEDQAQRPGTAADSAPPGGTSPGAAAAPARTQDGPAAGGSGPDAEAAHAAAGDAGAPAAAAAEPVAAELAAAEARAVASHEQYLRAVAETENVRRRGQEEIAKARKFAIESFAESLLPVIDSLEMALKVEAPTVASLHEGVEATLRLMTSAFGKHHLVGIDPTGERFDPNQHQAISMVPGDSTTPPTPPSHVVTVLQKGYLINERVLRPALVTVAQG